MDNNSLCNFRPVKGTSVVNKVKHSALLTIYPGNTQLITSSLQQKSIVCCKTMQGQKDPYLSQQRSNDAKVYQQWCHSTGHKSLVTSSKNLALFPKKPPIRVQDCCQMVLDLVTPKGCKAELT